MHEHVHTLNEAVYAMYVHGTKLLQTKSVQAHTGWYVSHQNAFTINSIFIPFEDSMMSASMH